MGGPTQAQRAYADGAAHHAARAKPAGGNRRPRWRVVQGREVIVESTFDRTTIAALRERGHHIVVEDPPRV